MCIEMLNMFQRIGSIHKTITRFSLLFNNYQLSLFFTLILKWRFPICKNKLNQIHASFKLVLEGKTGKEVSVSSKLDLLEKFLAKIFALSDAKDNNSGLLNRGGIVDLPSFWEHY